MLRIARFAVRAAGQAHARFRIVRHCASTSPYSGQGALSMIERLPSPQTWNAFATLSPLVREEGTTAATVIAWVAPMTRFTAPSGRVASDHSTIKMRALSFLLVVGVVLIAGGFGHHVPKGCICFGMVFALGVECSTSARSSVPPSRWTRTTPANLRRRRHGVYAAECVTASTPPRGPREWPRRRETGAPPAATRSSRRAACRRS